MRLSFRALVALICPTAPFPTCVQAVYPPSPSDSQPIFRLQVAQQSSGKTPSFSFDWQLDLPPSDSVDSSGPVHADSGLHALRIHSGPRVCDDTLMPTLEDATGPVSISVPKQTQEPPPPPRLARDPDDSVAPGMGAAPFTRGLPTPPNSRIGNLRKYSSLNFDELDRDSLSVPSPKLHAESSSGRQPSAILRKSKSILALSRDSLRLGDDSFSTNASHWTHKLRVWPRSDSAGTVSPPLMPDVPPVPPVPPMPAPADLPRGVEHIGEGIGYTYRGNGRRRSLILASLTPRTCHGIFAGRRTKQKAPHKDGTSQDSSEKEKDAAGAQVRSSGEGAEKERTSELGERGVEEDEEDLMDEVMREIYGDDWNAGMSPQLRQGQQSQVAGGGTEWGIATPPSTRFGLAEDASFGGPDCTLRLVTSPSTPWLGSRGL